MLFFAHVNSYKPEIFIDTWGASRFAPSAEDLKAFVPLSFVFVSLFSVFQSSQKSKKAFIKKIHIDFYTHEYSLFVHNAYIDFFCIEPSVNS